MSETYTTAEVQKHKDEANGFWLIVENDVYDVTSMTILSPVVESYLMLTFICRLHRRAPRRRQDPEALVWKECHKGFLEVSQ
jgi:hypothetical protein